MIISAKIALIAFFIILVKFVTKRVCNKKVDMFFTRIYKTAGYIMVGASLVHMICSFRAFSTTTIWVYVLGALSIVAAILAFTAFKWHKKGLKWHRLFSIISVVAMLGHLILK